MKYKIGWEKNGKWKYLVVDSHEEMLEEVADKTVSSDKVSVRAIKEVGLTRRCASGCKDFVSTVKTDPASGHIGFCRKTGKTVKDTLCGCRTDNGKTVLINFGEGGKSRV